MRSRSDEHFAESIVGRRRVEFTVQRSFEGFSSVAHSLIFHGDEVSVLLDPNLRSGR